MARESTVNGAESVTLSSDLFLSASNAADANGLFLFDYNMFSCTEFELFCCCKFQIFI